MSILIVALALDYIFFSPLHALSPFVFAFSNAYCVVSPLHFFFFFFLSTFSS